MRLPAIPGPGDVLALVSRSSGAIEQLLGLVPRITQLVGAAEVVLGDIQALLVRVEGTRSAADVAVERIGMTQQDADEVIRRIGKTQQDADRAIQRIDKTQAAAGTAIERIEGTRTSAEALVSRAQVPIDRIVRLLDAFEPALVRLQPTLDKLAETTSPEEVDAITRLANHLPGLVDQFERDVLPVLPTLRTVAPDVRDLLDVMQELNQLLGKVPGMGRIKKKVDEQQAEEDADD
jgi:ABC-type transporter Mla subunit MlaD